jgi:predicted aspartyl protease
MKLAHILIVFFAISLKSNGQEAKGYSDSGIIPLELIKEKIIIPVELNGKMYKFLIDTGGILEISENLQNEFNFKETESTTIVGINRKEIEIKTVNVPEIKLGNWTFKNRKAIVSNLHSKYPYSCFELDGMIGRDFFEKVILQFDNASNTFRITENSNAIKVIKNHRTKLKVSKRGLPNVKLKINDKNEYIEFDSGSGDFYSPKTSDVERKMKNDGLNKILSFYGEFSFGITMDNINHTYRYMQKVERFQIANTTFSNFYSQFSKVSAPRIGAGILKYGKVTLDFKNGWFYYEPYSESQRFKPLKTFGFDIKIEKGMYIVKYILKGSQAEKKGLEPENRILMINDYSTTNISEDCFGYLNGYEFKKKEKIKIKYLNSQGIEKSINLNKKTFE